MNSPIKIIYKYKNDNRKNQYQYYIFVGSLIPTPIQKILKKMQDLNFFDTLITLSEKEIFNLVDFYGEYWYKYFFLTEHLSGSIQAITKSVQKRNDIIQKFSKEWYETHIESIKYMTRSKYNYQTIFKRDSKIKSKKQDLYEEEFEENNYKTSGNIIIESSNLTDMIGGKSAKFDSAKFDSAKGDSAKGDSAKGKLAKGDSAKFDSAKGDSAKGGKINSDDSDEDNEQMELDVDDSELKIDFDKPIDENYEGEEIDVEDSYDIEEIDNMFKDPEVQIDSNADKIKDLIDSAIDKADEERDEKMEKMCPFNKIKNSSPYDDLLKNVFIKNYVYNQYIFDTDTIKVIKQKICTGFLSDNKFNKLTPWIIPSRMYLWSEYEYNANTSSDQTTEDKPSYIRDKIMLGQKWIRRNELLAIDIEPNNSLYIYEKLKGNLKLLKDNIKKYGSKIKREDDENNILSEYDSYYLNNEIFMIDIYNDIGAGYKINLEEQKNLYDVYVRIYYYDITQDEFKNIIDYVNNNIDAKRFESNKIISVFQNIQNDLLLEGEITRTIEQVKIDKLDYRSLLNSNFITQAVIHVNLIFSSIHDNDKINLYRIFDSFIVNPIYPFVQYQGNGDKLVFKFNQKDQELDKQSILSKWFENSPYGINFKIKVNQKGGSNNKYIAVTLYETGRLEYKTQWKEEDKATLEDIRSTYSNIKELINKINLENYKLKLVSPDDYQFKYAFINTIQHFELPAKRAIDHNDLSDFARYFFPYVSLVTDPRKRLSKSVEKNDKSKYGTYLRYKHISKYDNEAKVENRIIHFLRNYEFIPKILAIEISKQFNITEKIALEKIDEVIKKHPLLKKSRKILKKLENIPKFKLPGIGIDIQGRSKDNYKIRISGARSQKQLDQILEFMAILLYLYTDTYLIKNPLRIKIKEKLKTLTNIAKRRNRVDEVINIEKLDTSNIKEITKLDKDRLGYKPGKNENQWARNCQKSGDKNRRPILYTEKNLDEMIKLGYILNSKTGDYERKVVITEKGKKKDVIIKAAKLQDHTTIFYTCNPEINGEFMHVGFLQRSANPSGLCGPCCFKKDPGVSKNKAKKDYHLQCLGKLKDKDITKNLAGDKLYILQDTNKMLPGRFGYLSKYLDYFFNGMLDKNKKVKNSYLLESISGYFMKFGSGQEDYSYLSAIASCLDIEYDIIKNKLVSAIKSSDQLFIYAGSGDIKTQFGTVDNLISILNTNLELDHTIIDDIISAPGVIVPDGLNIYIIEKKIHAITEQVDFVLLCKNIENIIYYQDPLRKNIILLKEDFNYYPIVDVYKEISDKNIKLQTVYSINSDKIIPHLAKYMALSCENITWANIKLLNAKNTYYTLAQSNLSIKIVEQIIDSRNKCKYLVTSDGYLIPTKPSGVVFGIPITKSFDIYKKSVKQTIQFIKSINSAIKIEVVGFIYSNLLNDKDSDSKYLIEAIYIDNQILLPVISEKFNKSTLDQLSPNCIIESRSLYDTIDIEIEKGNKFVEPDNRVINTLKNKFDSEHYELFRFELANYLNLYPSIHNKIVKILESKQSDKVIAIKSILFKITSDELFEIFTKLDSDSESDSESKVQDGGDSSNFVIVTNVEPDLKGYIVKNNRELCLNIKSKAECSSNPHCSQVKSKCLYSLTQNKLIEFISRVTDELVNNDLKSKEILSIERYFVSDIVNYNDYTYRPNQKIIKSDNLNINKILSEIFGKSNIPIIGRRKIIKSSKTINDENLIHPVERTGSTYLQKIVNSNVIFRAYANAVYWIKNYISDPTFRNLGYYSILQTDLANIFKSYIYDWISNTNNQTKLYDEFINHKIIKISFENFISEYKTKLFLHKEYYYLGLVDLYILNQYHQIPILLIDQYDKCFFVIDNKIVYNTLTEDNEKFNKKYLEKNNIKIKYIGSKVYLNITPMNLIVINEI
jgi:hypothetical protein